MKPSENGDVLLSPQQCRAARGVLHWTYIDTCKAAYIAQPTLMKFEAGGTVRRPIVARLRLAFESAGLTFTDEGLGLRWRPDAC